MPQADPLVTFASGAALGCALTLLCFRKSGPHGVKCQHNKVTPDPARVLEDDNSLFYGLRDELSTVRSESKLLPSDVYGEVVRRMPVFCVDVIVRKGGKLLLLHRGMEPVKGYWWWPGGRMLKGETFYAAALRKVQQETGITQCRAVAVLGVYNTFFPTSSWDTDATQGTHTVNACVLVDAQNDATVTLDETSDNHKWISGDATQAIADGYDRYVWEQVKLASQHS
eukprot:TRINITY_DN65823_c0_g1_i1.p1 TRINITY_DN65823_c0_g1~~TRINITY_DN65823_c0_g1_i1.p1  ORF type:complete len:239 (+),score=65.77 TRINITY_DN65823_c0_g1_i1:42-719(+)